LTRLSNTPWKNKPGIGTPKPAVKSVLIWNYARKHDKYNGYGCVDVYDAINYLGYLAMSSLTPTTITLIYPRTRVNVRVNVTFSYDVGISNALRLLVNYGVKYRLYLYIGGDRWKLIRSGNLYKAESGECWDLWSRHIYLTGYQVGKFKIELSWNLPQEFQLLAFTNTPVIIIYLINPF